ncbi:MAG: Nuclease SbcCD subunit D [Firmicutes bacterium]|nr:Nuclease SbcCD subunit D [Bacillota bacterium]
MKIVHLSDLHLGKRVNEFPMLEDQEFILLKILNIIDNEQPQAVIIAGDVYDKSVPSAEVVQMLDDFLYKLSQRGAQVFVVSGNHDSPERMSFGARIMEKSGVHFSPVYNGVVSPVAMQDEYGAVCVYMLPFVRPAQVRRFYEDEAIKSYTDAVRATIAHMDIEPSVRNILVTHQFVTGSIRSDSEDISVGGADNVDASVFALFDYVALGHIHGPQHVWKETIRYSGTPLKYSFSERDHTKSVTVLEMREKGHVVIHTVPLVPKHDLRQIKGTYMELTAKSNYDGTATDDYLNIILTDEADVPDAVGRLRAVYPNLMKLEYDNARTRSKSELGGIENVAHKTELELFTELYAKQNGQPMSDEQIAWSIELFEKAKEAAR